MTRIIRIDHCDRCPHLRHGCDEPLRCSAAFEVWHGHQVSRRFRLADPYPYIPDWCPLEQVAPDQGPEP